MKYPVANKENEIKNIARRKRVRQLTIKTKEQFQLFFNRRIAGVAYNFISFCQRI